MCSTGFAVAVLAVGVLEAPIVVGVDRAVTAWGEDWIRLVVVEDMLAITLPFISIM